jgi:hypothetical protein
LQPVRKPEPWRGGVEIEIEELEVEVEVEEEDEDDDDEERPVSLLLLPPPSLTSVGPISHSQASAVASALILAERYGRGLEKSTAKAAGSHEGNSDLRIVRVLFVVSLGASALSFFVRSTIAS